MDSFNTLSTFEVVIVLLSVFFLALVQIIATWRVYEKAGQPGWTSIIPILNLYFLLKIVGKPGWWLIWMFVPFANLVVAIWVTNLLSKSFGKGVAFTLGLLLLPVIFYAILGFGDAEYIGPAGKPKVTEVNV
ncbi:DUF5684 domain-containing protein [Candidatus Sulfidibacterium hydrothermale]|uniref:DUF5684 domain-containing protein n=1 Tax=Candidatus Sulfidibacterium hydrothermale TaxID=2875962 RepID=UPI001F0AC000|nr:DUF5684 domain-containing protein [Candidatus Sulfidibacterium hydrothermale]UBM62183.1 DUF5684 domain-containing protein [Candidatus Sulfidibacterium hydrothermale]